MEDPPATCCLEDVSPRAERRTEQEHPNVGRALSPSGYVLPIRYVGPLQASYGYHAYPLYAREGDSSTLSLSLSQDSRRERSDA